MCILNDINEILNVGLGTRASGSLNNFSCYFEMIFAKLDKIAIVLIIDNNNKGKATQMQRLALNKLNHESQMLSAFLVLFDSTE